MSKLTTKCKILCCVAIICLLSGFYICTISPKTVFIGIAVMGLGVGFAVSVLFKLIQLINEEKENRIKKLEEDVELMKKNILY